ncbi:acyclic terpene utilization AtuA family protein [Castellaniella sp. GW247-6E4]|uniref:acyclic terpene utilization AtuA family protein n=1 Tax=Castellaniella sp. GW247-6E4 TaxID=3140380 RepID=UPI003314A095
MQDTERKVVRIGGASGFWGDSAVAAPQLVRDGRIDYLVFDYLAELTMAILVSARRKDSSLGYATDFIDHTMRSVLVEVVKQGIKVVSNAGGINPEGCADALARLAEELGVSVKIAVVLGDDVSAHIPDLRRARQNDMFTGAELPQDILSANAYLGALPIAEALRQGADIVITGRCVDSAVTLGPLIHEFGWSDQEYDKLAGGSLAGHIIECGCQATGGLHTDWEDIPDWPIIGYPIVECHEDGLFVVTKPMGTGGRILSAAVAEQVVYEIGDPSAYILPDVVCDFRNVRVEQDGQDRVIVSGARGLPPPSSYKVSATYSDGYRCAGSLVILGIDAVRKARRTGESILKRTREIFRQRGLADYSASRVEIIGAEDTYGPHARTRAAREVLMRVAVHHASKEALGIFSREIAPAGTSWSPGTTGPSLARPAVSPLVKQFAFTLSKGLVPIQIRMGGQDRSVMIPPGDDEVRASPQDPILETPPAEGWTVAVPLVRLAYARSGDKGNISNIGVIARKPEYLPLILGQVTPEAVKLYFSHLVNGEVRRFLLPGIYACNFLLFDALDGGGTASLRMDPLGKGMGQMLLDMTVMVPEELARSLVPDSRQA